MAKTEKGQKYNRVPAYARKSPSGAKVKVGAHVRSNPSTSKGDTK